MARHKKYQLGEEANPALDISSLIDVCFLLLIYFLVATTIQKKEVDVPLALPAMSSADSNMPDIEPLFIKVDANGAIFTGAGASQQMLDTDSSVRVLPLLTQQLTLYAAGANSGDKKPLVQMWVDPGANQQRVIDVLNALVGAGISSVTFTDLVD
jgi:biopolymer transport protein ExbD